MKHVELALIIVSMAAAALLVGLLFYRSMMARRLQKLLDEVKREKELRHMTELQLRQAQVNPHFLYNTLEAVMWLAEAGRQQETVHMLDSLSAFFRTSLSKGQDMIRLKEEMELTKSYMEIQKVRFRDIMEYEILLPEELWEIRLPKLTIQPLAENALNHGIRKKRGKGMIRMSCQEQEGDVLLIVEDNGIGMKPERQRELEQALNIVEDNGTGRKPERQRELEQALYKEGSSEGFGISVVHERIKLYFGADYGVKIFSEYGKGTRIEVRISKNVQPIC